MIVLIINANCKKNICFIITVVHPLIAALHGCWCLLLLLVPFDLWLIKIYYVLIGVFIQYQMVLPKEIIVSILLVKLKAQMTDCNCTPRFAHKNKKSLDLAIGEGENGVYWLLACYFKYSLMLSKVPLD